jgi:hypothetical protein
MEAASVAKTNVERSMPFESVGPTLRGRRSDRPAAIAPAPASAILDDGRN